MVAFFPQHYVHLCLTTNRVVLVVFDGVEKPQLHPLYHFTFQLDAKQLSLLHQLTKPTFLDRCQCFGAPEPTSLLDRVQRDVCGACEYHINHLAERQDALAKIESVIRLVQGKYMNGPWKPLAGFFGMYYRELSNELSEIPPLNYAS
jgi:hypothetical protein